MERMRDYKVIKLLKKWKIPTVKQVFAKSEKQAVAAAKKIGFPVALKVSSPDILHKSDVGGVVLDIQDEESLKKEYSGMIKKIRKKKKKAAISGVLVQEMVSGKHAREVILGCKHDKTFGPVVMLGLGGIFVEVIKDVSFRLAPVKKEEAEKMIEELKGYPVLKGVRGQRSINFKALKKIMVKFSKMVAKENKIEEMDINPLFVDEKKALAGDVRVLL